jgi:hypothetical protein|tara:strand:+ start:100 stop:291 length:192 start_codon:yes stop_codon:yes gene_type:complete
MAKPKPITSKSGVVKVSAEEIIKGNVKIEFLKELGSYKKGDIVEYHVSTANSLIGKGLCKEVK